MKGKQTSWGAVADWYDELVEDGADSYQKQVIMPNLLRIVEPRPSMAVLDVACGQGYFSRAFASNGATVVGSDISAELIRLAEAEEKAKTADGGAKGGGAHIAYHVAPSHKLDFMADASADVVTIVLALQNIEHIADTMAECSRVLALGGRLVVVLNHPAFRIPQASSWQWDEAQGKQYRRIDMYMSDRTLEIDMTPGEKVRAQKKFTISFHRPLQSYFKAFSKAGFSVTRLEEWISHRKSQKGPRGAEEDRMRKEIPLFVCLEARKVN